MSQKELKMPSMRSKDSFSKLKKTLQQSYETEPYPFNQTFQNNSILTTYIKEYCEEFSDIIYSYGNICSHAQILAGII